VIKKTDINISTSHIVAIALRKKNGVIFYNYLVKYWVLTNLYFSDTIDVAFHYTREFAMNISRGTQFCNWLLRLCKSQLGFQEFAWVNANLFKGQQATFTDA